MKNTVKKNILKLSLLIFIAVLVMALVPLVAACKKDNSSTTADSDSAGAGSTDAKDTANVSSALSYTDFVLDDLEGNPLSLSSFNGKIIVLNFWATWCPPCREEIPDFIEVNKQYTNKNVQFLGISSEDVETVKKFADEFSINYPVLIDKTGEVFRQWKIDAIPHTFIFSEDGEIVFDQVGLMTRDQLVYVIEDELKQ